MAPRKPIDQSDHDLLVSIKAMVEDLKLDTKDMKTALYGESGTNGIVGWFHELRTRVVYIIVVLGGLVTAVTYLVVIHIKP